MTQHATAKFWSPIQARWFRFNLKDNDIVLEANVPESKLGWVEINIPKEINGFLANRNPVYYSVHEDNIYYSFSHMFQGEALVHHHKLAVHHHHHHHFLFPQKIARDKLPPDYTANFLIAEKYDFSQIQPPYQSLKKKEDLKTLFLASPHLEEVTFRIPTLWQRELMWELIAPDLKSLQAENKSLQEWIAALKHILAGDNVDGFSYSLETQNNIMALRGLIISGKFYAFNEDLFYQKEEHNVINYNVSLADIHHFINYFFLQILKKAGQDITAIQIQPLIPELSQRHVNLSQPSFYRGLSPIQSDFLEELNADITHQRRNVAFSYARYYQLESLMHATRAYLSATDVPPADDALYDVLNDLYVVVYAQENFDNLELEAKHQAVRRAIITALQAFVDNWPVPQWLDYLIKEKTLFTMADVILFENLSEDDSHVLAKRLWFLAADVDAITFLLNRGADIDQENAYGFTLLQQSLHVAEVEADLDDNLIRLLLNEGANINKINRHYTPLHTAIIKPYPTLLNLLIQQYHADVNCFSWKKSPLYWAIDTKNLNIVKVLVENGANIQRVDDHNNSALHKAVLEKSIGIVQYLIAKNADVKQRNNGDELPFHLAINKMNYLLVTLFVEKDRTLLHEKERLYLPLHLAHQNQNTWIFPYLIQEYIKDIRSEYIVWFENLVSEDREKIEAILQRFPQFLQNYLNENSNNCFYFLTPSQIFFAEVKNILRNKDEVLSKDEGEPPSKKRKFGFS